MNIDSLSLPSLRYIFSTNPKLLKVVIHLVLNVLNFDANRLHVLFMHEFLKSIIRFFQHTMPNVFCLEVHFSPAGLDTAFHASIWYANYILKLPSWSHLAPINFWNLTNIDSHCTKHVVHINLPNHGLAEWNLLSYGLCQIN